MVVVQTFENVIFGLTGSQWIMIIEMAVIGLLVLAIIALITLAGPTFGYIKARMKNIRNVGVVIQNHDVTIKPMDYFAEVFKALGLTWIQRKKENHNFGSLNCEIVADFWGITMNAKDNLAIQRLINDWNNPEYTENGFPEPSSREQIVDYETLYDAVGKLPTDHQIKIRAFSYVPVYELKNYLGPSSAASFAAEREALKSIDEERIESSTSYAWVWPLVALIGGFLMGKFL